MTEPTAASIEAEFPGVKVITNLPGGLVHATIPHTETWAAGEDLMDLRDTLIRQKWHRDDAAAKASELQSGPGGATNTVDPGPGPPRRGCAER